MWIKAASWWSGSEMKPQALKRLIDALQAIEAIERFTAGLDLDSYLNNELLQAAVERKLEILGKALKKASEAEANLTDAIPDLRAIISTRNRIIHVYDEVDQLILWDAISNDLDQLEKDIKTILERS